MNDAYLQQMLSRLDQEAAERGRTSTVVDVASEATPTSLPENRSGSPPPRNPPSTPDSAQLLREKIASLSAKATQCDPAQVATAAPKASAQAKPAIVPSAGTPQTARPRALPVQPPPGEAFVPLAPTCLAESGLGEVEVEGLVVKFLMSRFTASGREIAEQLHLPFRLIEPLLAQLKTDQRVIHKSSAALTDYVYQLTASGLEEARQRHRSSSYFGAAPVSLDDYIASVHAQSITRQHCDSQDMACVFDDLIVGTELQNQIGQAVHGGQGFFLYGAAGNGKTSIAERVARAFGQYIWIPRAIGIDGEVIRLYDPGKHVAVPFTASDTTIDPGKVDRRWLRIRRPTIVAGGELTLEQLEITVNKMTGISEAPLQLKSSCGILVIDDFGRQRMSAAELLNRWIVPLDRRHDYLSLPSGKIVQVPFDQLLVFSTNLQPKDLFDEAFLRRLPYKIEVPDPTETEFRKLLQFYAQRLDIGFHAPAVEHVIDTHYRRAGRPFRACHARDLLTQIRNYCQFNKLPVAMTSNAFDVAVRNYFALLG